MTLEQLEEKLRGREPGLMDASGQYAVLVPLVDEGQWQRHADRMENNDEH